jgi:UDP-N-acetyl-D-mannosaminuronic acid dehydrogenase
MPLVDLKKKIADRSARIGVIGLGYVGLPVAALFARKGFNVVGIDIKAERVERINQGISPIEGKEPGLTELIAEVAASKRLNSGTAYSLLHDCDIVLIDVETPVNDAHIAEYHALKAALKSLGRVMKAEVLVIIESTIMPGTMQKIVLPLLEKYSRRKCGDGFYLGNCPERVMPGRLINNLNKMSRVVGGDSPATTDVMKELYMQVVEADIDEADWITAELVKTVENTYRDVQIAFANEVALICEALGADVWRVRDLVRKSPGREMLLPGAGVGGHCIPKDPWLLASAVRGQDVELHLIPAARAVNRGMPRHVLRLLKGKLGDLGGKKILVLGYAYLEESDDTRDSPSDHLIHLLEAEGAEAVAHDPFVTKYAGDIYALAEDSHAAVLMTAHSEYKDLDFKRLKNLMTRPLLVDGRNLWKSIGPKTVGFELVRLGDFSRQD